MFNLYTFENNLNSSVKNYRVTSNYKKMITFIGKQRSELMKKQIYIIVGNTIKNNIMLISYFCLKISFLRGIAKNNFW